jgi:predicted RNA-binding Zn ribbon-like protein
MRVREDLVDLLQSNEDVLRWLKQAGFPVPAFSRKAKPPALLGSARCLRENIRRLLEKRKLGKRGDPAILNRFLMADRNYAQLMWRKSRFTIETVRLHETAESILAPIAEAAADLLTNANFELVKRCEARTCVSWFCDRTRSHRRRWCSIETCGNRHKVAAYRKRLRDHSSRR